MNINQNDSIKNFICEKKIINENELKRYLSKIVPNYNENYYSNYLFNLSKNDVLYKYKTNILKSSMNRFKFNLDSNLDNELVFELRKINPPIIISIWNLSILNEYKTLQFMKNIYIVETYDYATEQLLNQMISLEKNVCLEKDYEIIQKYNKNHDLYVIKSMNVDSPLINMKSLLKTNKDQTIVTAPKLEKIIVDLFVDKFYQSFFGIDLDIIYQNLLKKYQVNFITVFRYARKRHCYEKLVEYLKSINFDLESGEFK